MTVHASAPGKLMLLGEYAVLTGAPALVAAVDRRAQGTLTPTDGAWHRLFAAPLGLAGWPFRVDGGRIVPGQQIPAGTRERLRLFERAVEMVAQTVIGEAPLPPHTITLDTEAFRDAQGRKLGLGSSAALTVALVGALRAVLRAPTNPGDVFPAAFRAHRAAQGERGSGFDVAAACRGGVLRYRAPEAGRVTPAEAEPMAWPDGLGLAVVFTGASADTASLTSRVSAAARQRPGPLAAAHRRLADLATSGIAAFAAADRAAFLDVVGRTTAGLAELGRLAGVEIVTPAHARIAQRAAALGLAYKPSGAGGGDIGVAFGEPALLSELAPRLTDLGATLVPLSAGAPGLTVERLPDAP